MNPFAENPNKILDSYYDTLYFLNNSTISELPIAKAMSLMAENFRRLGLPLKHIGKIKVNINESFFEDEDKAKTIIILFCEVLKKIWDFLLEEFGEDAEYIFADMLKEQSLTYQM